MIKYMVMVNHASVKLNPWNWLQNVSQIQTGGLIFKIDLVQYPSLLERTQILPARLPRTKWNLDIIGRRTIQNALKGSKVI